MATVLRSADAPAVVPPALLELAARTIYFPVRHHSPNCARLVRDFIRHERPAAVLIEGPSDFNKRLAELRLPHQLPIAIYSYVHLSDGSRRGAFYPFCEYSPEQQAVLAAAEVGAVTRFIDLPWAELAAERDAAVNRYSDAELRFGRYVRTVCRRLGVEDFDAAWDVMIEQDGALSLEEYFARCHHYCCQTRALQDEISPSDERREACMARFVAAAEAEFPEGRILVVTGGFHSPAIQRRVTDGDFRSPPSSPDAPTVTDRGIALTPYSYERLDSLRGYEAGMPNPGFYHQVWRNRAAGDAVSHHPLLVQLVDRLRKRGQTCSTADLIAVETMARALATLRGREEVWRNDLLDAVTGSLVKEELDRRNSPFLAAVHDVLRGGERGRLAAGAALPPLVLDLQNELHRLQLEPQPAPRDVTLELESPGDLEKSRVLHRLRLLSITGFERVDGTDIAGRENLTRWFEVWSLRWRPELEAASIEAARYGSSLREGANARLLERAQAIERDAEQAALVLLDAALAGGDLPPLLLNELAGLIATDNDFLAVSAALGHLLFLFQFDEVLGTGGHPALGELLAGASARGVWLLEQLGQVTGQERKMLVALKTLLDVFERAQGPLELDREEFVAVLQRVQDDTLQSAVMRGAAAGALANLGAVEAERIRADLRLFADPTQLGDYLSGLFFLARELAQRDPELVRGIDDLLVQWSADEFVAALPSFRLAFTYFTPREKHHLLTTLFKALGLGPAQPLARLEVDPQAAAAALAAESRVFGIVNRFGLRGGDA